MKKLFLGLLFLLLEFTLRLGDASFSLLPSFVGYLLIAWGLAEPLPFAKEKENRLYYILLAVLELGWFGWWCYNTLFAPSHDDRTIILAGLKTLLVLIAYFAVRRLLRVLSAYEGENKMALHTERLFQTLKFATIFTSVGHGLSFLSMFDLDEAILVPLSLLSSLGIAVGHALSVVFLTLFYLTWKAAEETKPVVGDDE